MLTPQVFMQGNDISQLRCPTTNANIAKCRSFTLATHSPVTSLGAGACTGTDYNYKHRYMSDTNAHAAVAQ